jgi:hypothetical protein
MNAIKRGKIWRRQGGESLTNPTREGGDLTMEQLELAFKKKEMSRQAWEQHLINEAKQKIEEKKNEQTQKQ